MGDGSLSQDEIDALLNMGDDADAGGAPAGGDLGMDFGGGDGGGGDLNLDSLIGGGGGDDAPAMGGGGALDQAALDALSGLAGPAPAAPAPASPGGGVTAAPSGGDGQDNADLLMDVTLRFSVELGRTHMYIKDVLQLTEGSVVELDKVVGDEVDILVNDRLFGRGKLVVMDEFFGIQITHILDPLERYRVL